MDYNTPGFRKVLIEIFGNALKSDPNFKLTSQPTYRYNCIAFAMGMSDRWVDVANLPWHWWPPVQKDDTINSLIAAFEYFGFEKCGMDDNIDEKYDKVVLYGKDNQWQHAAKVVAPNVYHSKFGESFDGTHSSGNVLSVKYGDPYVVMRRKKILAHTTDDLKGAFEGFIRTCRKIPIGIGVEDSVIIYRGKTYLEHLGNEIVLGYGTYSILPLETSPNN